MRKIYHIFIFICLGVFSAPLQAQINPEPADRPVPDSTIRYNYETQSNRTQPNDVVESSGNSRNNRNTMTDERSRTRSARQEEKMYKMEERESRRTERAVRQSLNAEKQRERAERNAEKARLRAQRARDKAERSIQEYRGRDQY